jgi:hypothetical protein
MTRGDFATPPTTTELGLVGPGRARLEGRARAGRAGRMLGAQMLRWYGPRVEWAVHSDKMRLGLLYEDTYFVDARKGKTPTRSSASTASHGG